MDQYRHYLNSAFTCIQYRNEPFEFLKMMNLGDPILFFKNFNEQYTEQFAVLVPR